MREGGQVHLDSLTGFGNQNDTEFNTDVKCLLVDWFEWGTFDLFDIVLECFNLVFFAFM